MYRVFLTARHVRIDLNMPAYAYYDELGYNVTEDLQQWFLENGVERKNYYVNFTPDQGQIWYVDINAPQRIAALFKVYWT